MNEIYQPNPVEHAVVLVEVLGTIDAARNIAECNIDFASTMHDFRYWQAVAQALSEEALCIVN